MRSRHRRRSRRRRSATLRTWLNDLDRLQLLIASLILFSLGIISEFLARILDETRKRPIDRGRPTSKPAFGKKRRSRHQPDG